MICVRRPNTGRHARLSATCARFKCTGTSVRSIRVRCLKTTDVYPRPRTLIGCHYLGFSTARGTLPSCWTGRKSRSSTASDLADMYVQNRYRSGDVLCTFSLCNRTQWLFYGGQGGHEKFFHIQKRLRGIIFKIINCWMI